MEEQRYNYYKQEHPEWTDEQIYTAISLDIKSKETVKAAGGEVRADDPDIIKKILIGAREWLESLLPTIFEKVKDAFDLLLERLQEWIKDKLEDIILVQLPEIIGNFIKKI